MFDFLTAKKHAHMPNRKILLINIQTSSSVFSYDCYFYQDNISFESVYCCFSCSSSHKFRFLRTLGYQTSNLRYHDFCILEKLVFRIYNQIRHFQKFYF